VAVSPIERDRFVSVWFDSKSGSVRVIVFIVFIVPLRFGRDAVHFHFDHLDLNDPSNDHINRSVGRSPDVELGVERTLIRFIVVVGSLGELSVQKSRGETRKKIYEGKIVHSTVSNTSRATLRRNKNKTQM
jgi:hypothetical protein